MTTRVDAAILLGMTIKQRFEWEFHHLVVFVCTLVGVAAMCGILFGCGAEAQDYAEQNGTTLLDTGEAAAELTGVPNNYGWLNSGGHQRCQHSPSNYGRNICLLPKFGGGGLVQIQYEWDNTFGTPVERSAIVQGIADFTNNNGGFPLNWFGMAQVAPGSDNGNWNIKLRFHAPGESNPFIPFQVGAVVSCPPLGCTLGSRHQYGQVRVDFSQTEMRNIENGVPTVYRDTAVKHMVNRALGIAMGLGYTPTPATANLLMNPNDQYSWSQLYETGEEYDMLRVYRP